MFSRYSRVFAFSTLMLSGAGAQAAMINVIDESATLNTVVGYSYYPDSYASSYTGSTFNNTTVMSDAVLLAGLDADENDVILGSGTPDAGPSHAAYAFARTNGGFAGNNFYYEVSNNSSQFAWIDGAEDIFDSVFSQSTATFSLLFEVLDGDSELLIDISELELNPNPLVSGAFRLRNVTTGDILEDVFAEDGFGGSYLLQNNHTYELVMSMNNTSTDDSGSAMHAQFGDQVVFSVPEPSTIYLFGIALLGGLFGFRQKHS